MTSVFGAVAELDEDVVLDIEEEEDEEVEKIDDVDEDDGADEEENCVVETVDRVELEVDGFEVCESAK